MLETHCCDKICLGSVLSMLEIHCCDKICLGLVMSTSFKFVRDIVARIEHRQNKLPVVNNWVIPEIPTQPNTDSTERHTICLFSRSCQAPTHEIGTWNLSIHWYSIQQTHQYCVCVMRVISKINNFLTPSTQTRISSKMTMVIVSVFFHWIILK